MKRSESSKIRILARNALSTWFRDHTREHCWQWDWEQKHEGIEVYRFSDISWNQLFNLRMSRKKTRFDNNINMKALNIVLSKDMKSVQDLLKDIFESLKSYWFTA